MTDLPSSSALPLQAVLEQETAIADMREMLLQGIEALSYSLIDTGDSLVELLEQQASDTERTNAFFFHFAYIERAKSLLILWRDVLFEHLKGKRLLADQQAKKAALREHWKQSATMLAEAGLELSSWAEEQQQWLTQTKEGLKQVREWELQNTPWDAYREQIASLAEQARHLISKDEEAASFAQIFHVIQLEVHENALQYLSALEDMIVIIQQALNLLNDENKKQPKTIAHKIGELEKEVRLTDHATTFKNKLEQLLEPLPEKWQQVVATNGGMLMHLDIDLKRKITQWLEGEALPLLYEVWELAELGKNETRLSLSNTQNRLQVPEQNNEEALDYGPLISPLQLLHDRLSDMHAELETHVTLLGERMRKDFFLSKIYKTDGVFLPTSMQMTVRQLDVTGGRLLRQASSTLRTVKNWYARIVSQVEQEEGMGYAEKIARYIESRTPDPSAYSYTSIFMTRGFVGSSFATGRQSEMAQLDQLIAQWEKGYRGAALLTGRRFCGKTFVGEWFASHRFARRTIRLVADQETLLEGRKLPATKDLKEVLRFVRKYALGKRPLVWIDNLERWQDNQNLLLDNVEALINFNDRFGTDCFVLVSVNHWMHQRLQSLLKIDSAFQATLHLDTMPTADIIHALLIRHGATHNQLVVSPGGDMLSAQAFRAVAKRVSRAAHENIGEALMWWISAIQMHADNTVSIAFADRYSMTPYPDADANLLIEEILLQKKTSEKRLRYQFGQAFNARYRSQLQRLLSIGVVERLPDGDMEINEAVVNALAGLLFRK